MRSAIARESTSHTLFVSLKPCLFGVLGQCSDRFFVSDMAEKCCKKKSLCRGIFAGIFSHKWRGSSINFGCRIECRDALFQTDPGSKSSSFRVRSYPENQSVFSRITAKSGSYCLCRAAKTLTQKTVSYGEILRKNTPQNYKKSIRISRFTRADSSAL